MKNINEIKELNHELNKIRSAINKKTLYDKNDLLYLQTTLDTSLKNYHIIMKNLLKIIKN